MCRASEFLWWVRWWVEKAKSEQKSDSYCFLSHKMADGVGLQKACPTNGLDLLTGPDGLIERKGLFPGLSNRAGPPGNKTAALTVISGGGKEDRKGGDRSGEEQYYTDRLTAIAPRIIALHFGVDR